MLVARYTEPRQHAKEKLPAVLHGGQEADDLFLVRKDYYFNFFEFCEHSSMNESQWVHYIFKRF